MPGLKPVVMALLTAFPVLGSAQVRVNLPPPPAFKVPIPATVPGWRVFGTGAAAPANTLNAAGGTDQVINQASLNAIYNWQSFDIGSASSVAFNFPSRAGSALNRVNGAAGPSQIFGRLTSYYPNPNAGESPLVGGSIYLINANGILFGRTAQVNTGALIASTLDLRNDDFNSGLTQSITSATPTFFTDGPGVPDSNGFVWVNPGAQITTPEGGRVFLFARNVGNAGTITTPGGQTALAAGDQVYLNLPTAEVIYASEVNPAIPALRGLLVEVGSGSGSVANLAGGAINTPRGNTTLVGMTVNQSGRISATTSVSDNGSVMLLARGGAQASIDQSSGGTLVKRATMEGTLTLGPGSSIEIAPDATLGANGLPATSDGNSVFTTSRVELDGRTVQLASGSSIVAHGGIVNVRSEAMPFYEEPVGATPVFNFAAFDGDLGSRLVVGESATIDVSGTTSAVVSAARNFVTTTLLGASDLKDAPLQKSGPIYRSKLTFDVRSPVPILGDTHSYTAGIQRSAIEQLAAGGRINLSSTGAVVTQETSNLNVSGGQVTYASALAAPSVLIGSDGALYTFNQAPANITYAGILGSTAKPAIDRWGVVPQWAPAQTQAGVVAPGYIDGRAGGTLTVAAPLAVLDGKIQATTTAGVRQTSGLDPLAAPGRVELGTRNNGLFAFGGADFTTSGLGDLAIAKDPGSMGGTFWVDPLNGTLPTAGRIGASTINASGLGQFVVTSDGNITQRSGADISLAQSSLVDLAAAGAGGIFLAGSFRSAGGSFSAETRNVTQSPIVSRALAGGVTLDAGSVLDVSGSWVNRALDGATARAAAGGGSVALSAAGALDVQAAARIDVSGGATVGTNGSVAGTAAGNISLESNVLRTFDDQAPAPIHIGAALVANSLNGGGTLSLSADSITIGMQPITGGVRDGQAPGSLVLSDTFFDNGAFTTYNIAAISSLVVQSGVALRPRASNWILTPDASTQRTGAAPASFMATGMLPDAQRKPVSLVLGAASRIGNPYGDLTLASGASIQTDPLASVTLKAGLNLDAEGRIRAPGGNVSVSLVGSATSNQPVSGSLILGSASSIDVSGETVLQPQTGPLPVGQVLAGGSVTLGVSGSASLTPIVVRPGALIEADGNSAMLGVTTTSAGGSTVTKQQTVASAGGSVTIASQGGGSVLAGTMHALGGDASVAAGTFSLTQTTLDSPQTASIIVVQKAAVAGGTAVANSVQVSADSLAAGFANATLQSEGAIRFAGDVSLALAGDLKLDAPVLAASPASRAVVLAGGSTLLAGSSYQLVPSLAKAIGGSASLDLRGGLVELFGQQTAQGFGNVKIASFSELRLASLTGAGPVQGKFSVQGDLTLNAPQILPTSNSQFNIDAPGQRVLLTGGDSTAAVPLSAGGSITIDARDITTLDPVDASRYGVVRAPFGSLTLNATDRIDIGAASRLSVSGAGMTVPFGQTAGQQNWTYGGTAVDAPAAKTINLNAPGRAVNVAAGAKLDLSGGGDLVSLEFVPGIGGSHDIFGAAASNSFAVVPTITAYAPQDRDILSLSNPQSASLPLGLQVTFGAGGPLPAGTYAVLPPRYAVLAGAYLVTPTAVAAPLALGAAVPQRDGSILVGGRYAEAGTGFGSSLPQSFRVQGSALAQTHSEVDKTSANSYFTALAAAAGQAAPALPTDAGRLDIVADQLSLKGGTAFALPTTTDASGRTTSTGRGGELDISAGAIEVGSVGAQAGVLSLSPADLNATGASLVVLGGQRGGVSGNAVTVTAGSVAVDNAGVPLKVNDLVLVANGTVELKAGADIEAPGASSAGTVAAAPPLSLDGDGALLRVSTDATAASVRSGAQRASGSLLIGAGARLSGGAITAEATNRNSIAGDASFGANAITLAANRIAVGQVNPATAGTTTLAITPALAAQIGGAKALTLRSFDGLDMYGSAVLGGASVNSLTLDTGTIRLVGSGAKATIEGGGVQLTNTSGARSAAAPGGNQLQIVASGAGNDAGTGRVVIGPGSLAVAGASGVSFDAARELVLADTAAFSSPGAINVAASGLQAARGASATLTAGGAFMLDSSGKPAPAGAGLGAHVLIEAATIEQAGSLVLPSGQLTLSASGASGPSGDAIRFASGSLTDLSGRSSSFDGVTVSTPGGTLVASATSGSIAVDRGATLDVSAPASGAAAGGMGFLAPTGALLLQGALRASAAAGQGGGSLRVDSSSPLDLTALAATLGAVPGNFGESLDLRNRRGDQRLAAGGSGLAARHISISTDAGSLSIAGSLDASGASGTTVLLAGGAGLDIESGAAITVHSTGAVGGLVQLLSGNLQVQANGTLTGSNGPVQFDGGVVDTAAAAGGVNGSLLVRAQRDAAGTDVLIGGAGNTSIRGTSSIEVEAVKQYVASNVNSTLIGTVTTDNAALGVNASQVRSRVSGLLGQPPAAVQLRAGVEVDAIGDMTVSGNAAAGGWNLTQFAANGQVIAQLTGAPIDLTLRAQGTLNVAASISDGFLPSGIVPTTSVTASRITPGAVVAEIGGSYAQGGRIRLIGGADDNAADVMKTTASSVVGDVVIGAAGKNVIVRSTTGNIDVAAGRDVTLLNSQAVVYTTGTPATSLPGYVGNTLPSAAYLSSGGIAQSSFLSGGGSLSVSAGRDVVGVDPLASVPQYGTEWSWRARDQPTLTAPPVWWSRYDQFQQGFATFGGGNVTAAAERDLVNAQFSAASSGYVARDAGGNPSRVQQFGGGDLGVQAGRDVVGGFVLAAGATGSVQAGRNILAGDDGYALQVLHGNTKVKIGALDDLGLGIVTSFGLVPATKEYTTQPLTLYVLGLAPQATLQVMASAGDVDYQGLARTDNSGPTALPRANGAPSVQDKIIPDNATFAAPSGSVASGTLLQVPAGTTSLNVLAADNLEASAITVTGTDARSASPTIVTDGAADVLNTLTAPPVSSATPYDSGVRSPMRLVAATGDLAVTAGISTTTALRAIAGRDVAFGPGHLGASFAVVTIQHQAADELSVVEAGRDILFPSSGRPIGADLQFYGPGDLIVLAGRNIDLSTSGGVQALGNRQNAALPAASGTVTVLAGVNLGANDYSQAEAWFFPLLGATGIAGHAADLAAQLAALQAGQPLPALGSSDASNFAALPIDAQVARTRTLVGEAAFDAALLADAQRRDANAALPLAQALAAFAKLSASDQYAVVVAALANAWVSTLPQPEQQQQALAMAGSGTGSMSYLSAMQRFMVAQGAASGLSAAQTLAAFQSLAPERQLIFTNEVLVSEIRKAGRTASALAGSARDAAYAPAYAALDVVFPDVGIPGNLSMGSSQIHTLQDSNIDILAPRGSVDVGTLAAGLNPKPTNALGIVTGAGGDISVVVRDSVNVNQSRVFTVGKGNLLMWASTGSLDAGRGAKTVTGAPPPVFSLDSSGHFIIDTTGSFTGSGIAVLDASSTLDLYAPKGEINAGDAGIKSLGNAFFGAAHFAGADNLSIGGLAVGAPPPASTGGATAGLSGVGQAANSAATRINPDDSEEEKERKRRKRLNLILDFLGFGDGSSKP